jgi:hypothetical protein
LNTALPYTDVIAADVEAGLDGVDVDAEPSGTKSRPDALGRRAVPARVSDEDAGRVGAVPSWA